MPGLVDGPAVATFGDTVAVVAPPPPPPAPQSEPVRLHSGIDTPIKIHDALPEYPALARSARAQGLVIIEATIDTDGRVVAARVLRSIPLLDDAAMQAVRQWQYTPARLNGEPISVLMTVTVRFALER
jgi:protein TonB